MIKYEEMLQTIKAFIITVRILTQENAACMCVCTHTHTHTPIQKTDATNTQILFQ